MRKNIFLLGALLAVSAATMAQTKQGGISAQMLSQIEKMQKTSVADKALFNAIAANSIDDLVKNRANAGPVDTHFSVETPAQRIHNQKSSGRCWMFSGMNVLRANFAKAHADSLTVEFSQDYLFFYDQLEKANLMLQGVIDHARKSIEDPQVQFFFKSPLNDGGTFCGVADLAAKYGLVPMSAMPETYSSENTNKMSRLVASKLREYGLELRRMAAAGKNAKQIAARKTEMLATVYHMLCLTLGEPVKEFSYAFRNKDGKQMGDAKTYTPKSFYDATVGKELNGTFIMVMNDPRRPTTRPTRWSTTATPTTATTGSISTCLWTRLPASPSPRSRMVARCTPATMWASSSTASAVISTSTTMIMPRSSVPRSQ